MKVYVGYENNIFLLCYVRSKWHAVEMSPVRCICGASKLDRESNEDACKNFGIHVTANEVKVVEYLDG